MSIRGKWRKNAAHPPKVITNVSTIPYEGVTLHESQFETMYWQYSYTEGRERLHLMSSHKTFDSIDWYKTNEGHPFHYVVVTPWDRIQTPPESHIDIIKSAMNRIEFKWAEIPGPFARRPIKDLSHAQCLKLGREQL